jgi:hypothetical protein
MQITGKGISRFLVLIVGLTCLVTMASATENGASVWPVGAESFATAAGVPHAGQTMVYEYTCFYEANELDDAKGKSAVPEFKVRVFAVAAKVSHNWGVNFLGGELGSYVAIPSVYQQLHVPGAKYTKDDLTNINLVPITIFNHKGIVHWYYEVQFETLGTGYSNADKLNIGQHNMAVTPAFGITLTPHHGQQNIMSRFDYVINGPDHVSHYHSGNEFFWQFDAQQEIPNHKVSVGVTGYYYKQITDDSLHGAAVVTTNMDGTQSIGYKGRAFDVGPQVTFPWGKHGAIIVKWDHDMLVQNKTRGNAFWFQFGIPFSYLHHTTNEGK